MKSRWIGLVFVVIFSILFAIRQYQPGTWLMGWDSLHPEFNYQLAFSRVLSGVWRESQGLGVVVVHSHMSELPRIATLWVIDLFVPTSAVRWTYFLLMLVFGVVGSYVLLVHILAMIRGKLGMGWVTLVAVVGSLAYLFNLSTLHHFLVPFEMFVVLFGVLPWSLWSVSRYLQVPGRQRLAFFLLIQFLISSCAFAATLWVVYFGALVLTTRFLTKNKRMWIKVLVLTLMVNSYWLLPTMYGLVTTGGAVASAKINQVFSPEAWLNNVAYGTAQQVMRMESFILQWMSFDRVNNKFDLVVSQWINGVNLNYVWWTLNIVSGMVGVGLLRWVYLNVGKNGKESRRWSGLVFAGLLLFLLLLSQVWPVNMAISWARENLPLVGEILRTPFTKVSIFLQLIYAALISIGLLWIVEKVRFGLVRAMIIIATVIVIVFPFTSWILTGNLIGEVVVTKMPWQYEKLFDSTKKMGNGRMVAMPMPNMWGWEYREWGNGDGYEGANFTQFGIVQPLLIRDFDRWSPYNEGFYNQISTALYSCESGQSEISNSQILKLDCGEQVQKVLEQYDVKYVLLDESVIAPGQGKEILRIEETKKLAEELKWEQKFQEGFLTVWDTGFEIGDKFVSAPESCTPAEGEVVKAREDVIYADSGSYVSGMGGVQYPFASLMREEVKNVEWGEEGVKVISNLKFSNSQMIVPGWEVGEIVRVDYEDGEAIPAYSVNGQAGPRFLGKEKPMGGKSYFYARVSEGEEWREYRSEHKFEIRNEKLEIEVRGEPFIYDFAKQGQGSIGNCDVLKRGVATKTDNTYFADERGAVCDYVVMEAPFTRVPHLLRLRGENIEGRSIKFFLYNTGSKRNDIEYLLSGDRISVNPYSREFDQTFALLPWDWDGYYTLNIETRSFGQRAENKIEPVVGMYVPIDKIASAKIITNPKFSNSQIGNRLQITHVKKTGTWLYGLGVKFNSQITNDEFSNGEQGLIRLSQGYDEGWVGVLIGDWSWNDPFGFAQGLRHVKVDGRSNGWLIEANPPTPMATDGHGGWIMDKSQIKNSLPAQAGQISNWEHEDQEAMIVVIFYWPQLLQYLGFAILGITLIGLLGRRG